MAKQVACAAVELQGIHEPKAVTERQQRVIRYIVANLRIPFTGTTAYEARQFISQHMRASRIQFAAEMAWLSPSGHRPYLSPYDEQDWPDIDL